MCIERWRIGGGETLVVRMEFGANENAATPTTVNVAMTNDVAADERLDRSIVNPVMNNACCQALLSSTPRR
jgi:hypothetical protein